MRASHAGKESPCLKIPLVLTKRPVARMAPLLALLLWTFCCAGLKAGDLKTSQGSRRTIILEQYEPDMPEGPGRRMFLTRCLVCHSARYVTMQPNFPPKVWDKLVHKMVKNFGAHITEKEAKEIVAYLVSIKGQVKK
jgi:mono/diheme cytochrome c family protein